MLAAVGFAALWMVPQPSLAAATISLAFIGFVGLANPLLIAHARTFYPDHLLGRGITFMNFLTIGGAGLVQWLSGVYIARMQAAGATPPEVYATHHLIFALLIGAASAIYMLAPVRRTPPG